MWMSSRFYCVCVILTSSLPCLATTFPDNLKSGQYVLDTTGDIDQYTIGEFNSTHIVAHKRQCYSVYVSIISSLISQLHR